jgi:hypothetical protein
MPERSREPAIALLIFAAAMVYFDRTLHLTLELRDEGFLLYNIARVAGGEIPHRDFIEVYGPGMYALTGPIFALFGERVWPIRELLAMVRAGAVVLAYLISCHFVPRPFALLATLFSLAFWGWSVWTLTTPYAALFTIPLCMLSLYLLLIGEARQRPGFHFAAGFVCGIALLFKWSLAAMSAYGMVIAVCAGAMLRCGSVNGAAANRARRSAPILIGWAMIASLVLIPFLETLSPFDYLLHIGPIHALMCVVAAAFACRGDGPTAFRQALPLVVRYCLGFLIAPLITFAVYASWGHLDDLIYNTVTRPLNYRNYYIPIAAPPFASVALLGCLASLVTTGLALLGRRFRLAVIFAVAAAALAPFGYPSARFWGVEHSLARMILQLPAITSYVTASVLAVDLVRRPGRPNAAIPVIVILLFQMMMTFQIYPRGSYNSTLMLGTLAPIIGYLAYRWFAIANGDISPPRLQRRAIAFALVAAIPLLLVYGKVGYALTAPQPRELPNLAFGHPALAGIHPKPDAWPRQNLAAFDELVSVLQTLQPTDAPVFVVPNDAMVYFLSDRKPLFEDEMLIFFLAGWKLLPENDRDAPSAEQIEARFEAHPDAIVITRPGNESAASLFEIFPSLQPYLAQHYRAIGRVGPYRVLRRRPAS